LTLKEKLNFYGSKKEPFFFIINFDLSDFEVIPLKKLPNNILYSIDGKIKNIKNNLESDIKNSNKNTKLKIKPIKYKQYKKRFKKVKKEIKEGNSYLLNLTTETNIESDLNLKQVFKETKAKFKLYYKDKIICFSPERFIKIKKDKIFTYPMKGTIDANIKNGREKLLKNPKELAEHIMIVDLLRNDLSIVSKGVKVDKFRYIDKIKAGDKKLLQVSSKISGNLTKDWRDKIGDILLPLLPAGSITGTPKKRTIDIIKNIEEYERGFFTGVFGIFDGDKLDSGVMIRFIEKKSDNKLVYKSGGGITSDSELKSEYQEMIDKVYLPF
jgi:para-aminobenzoate synthetase component 1